MASPQVFTELKLNWPISALGSNQTWDSFMLKNLGSQDGYVVFHQNGDVFFAFASVS